MQNYYNLLYREEEREMLPLCEDQGIGVIPWSPLARGRLTRPWDVTDRALARATNSAPPSTATIDKPVVDAVLRIASRPRRRARPGRPRLGALQSGRHQPHRRSDQAPPPRRRGRRALDRTRRRRDRRPSKRRYRPHSVIGIWRVLPRDDKRRLAA